MPTKFQQQPRSMERNLVSHDLNKTKNVNGKTRERQRKKVINKQIQQTQSGSTPHASMHAFMHVRPASEVS
jgi:hypothetical protein